MAQSSYEAQEEIEASGEETPAAKIHALDTETEEKDFKLSTRVVSSFLGELSGTAQAFERWRALVHERRGKLRPCGFSQRVTSRITVMPHEDSLLRHQDYSTEKMEASVDEAAHVCDTDQPQEASLWEKLGSAAVLNINYNEFSWDSLSSLHHTEHSSASEPSEDEMSKPLEVTVNSGGVVFFALFNSSSTGCGIPKESAAVIKFSSSKMATQSERLGFEFANQFGVQTPKARVIHSSSPEWKLIKSAVEKAREGAISNNDEVGQMTCSELLEALELSRCLLLMSYVHGSPLLENPKAFALRKAAEITAAALGRVLMLDLILRNEDRLPCRELGWRGNAGNLMMSDRMLSADDFGNNKPVSSKVCDKEGRSQSANGRLDFHVADYLSPCSDSFKGGSGIVETTTDDRFHVVAIDSGVPRRPPAGMRARDHERYPKVVELILNSAEYSSNMLYEISGGRLGTAGPEEGVAPNDSSSFSSDDLAAIVHEFRRGFRAGLQGLQGFHLFLLQLYQKLESHLRMYMNIMNRSTSESEFPDFGALDSSPAGSGFSTPCPFGKHILAEVNSETEAQRSTTKTASAGSSGNSADSASPLSRDISGRLSRGSGGADASRSLRMTIKLRDFNKVSKEDPALQAEIDQWTDALRSDVIKFCQENNFQSGFFDGAEGAMVVDAYELKVRLEHILERISLISDAASTERPSLVLGHLFIGGALAAKSKFTLQQLGITHVLCLCSNEIGQSESQYLELFEYKNFLVSDDDDANIGDLFEEASGFIDHVENVGGKVLVHCFEGKSRSSTVVLAYLMKRKGYTLARAWSVVKKVHRRAQPNDGFGKTLLELDQSLHGKVSMDWQHRRPEMKSCSICGKNVGLSTSSLKLHLQNAHKQLSSGSVDSAMTLEIQRTLESLKISRAGSLSPPHPSKKLSLAVIADAISADLCSGNSLT